MKLFAGSYTEWLSPEIIGKGAGIYVFNFNEQNGELTLLSTTKNRNTSFVAIDKTNKHLYSYQEILANKAPKILSYKIDNEKLKPIGEVDMPGGLPCHITTVPEKNCVIAACYETGHTVLFPIANQGNISPSTSHNQHIGTSSNQIRQEQAHAHMAYFNPEDKLLYVPDLGCDKVFVYSISNNRLKEEYNIPIPTGNGPRHISFHPNRLFAFVCNELTGTISLLKKNKTQFQYIDDFDTLTTSSNDASGSAIKISSDGKFIYMGLRSTNTIAILGFNEKTEKLRLVNHQDCFGKTPRDFEISPCGKFLLVANQDSASIIVFSIDRSTGLLTKLHENTDAKSVVCLQFENI